MGFAVAVVVDEMLHEYFRSFNKGFERQWMNFLSACFLPARISFGAFFFLTLFFKFLPHPQEQFHANLPNKNYHRNTVNTSYNIITGVMMAAVS